MIWKLYAKNINENKLFVWDITHTRIQVKCFITVISVPRKKENFIVLYIS